MNVLTLLNDASNIIRLRYQPAEHYHYPLPACLVVMLAIGSINAAGMTPIFGEGLATLSFAILVSVVRWLVLARAMTATLHYYGSPRLPLWGFVLVSEALMLPMVLLFYAPQLSPILMFWEAWIFWVQAIGFHHLSKQNGLKILLGYLLYVGTASVITGVLFVLFILAGWFDWETVQQNLELWLQRAAQP